MSKVFRKRPWILLIILLSCLAGSIITSIYSYRYAIYAGVGYADPI